MLDALSPVVQIAIDFWPEYQAAAGTYCLGEVWYEDSVDYLARYQDVGGLDAVFNFHLFKSLKRVFQWGDPLYVLRDSVQEEVCSSCQDLGASRQAQFIQSRDSQKGPSHVN